MSEDTKIDNVEPVINDDVTTQEPIITDDVSKKTVQFDTYSRVFKKLKTTETAFAALNERIQAMEQDKLEAEGNKDQLIDSLRKEVTETKIKLKTTVGSVARSQAMNAIIDEAVKAGCNSPDIITKFVEDQIDTLDFNDDFTPDREQVKLLVADAKERAPILFSKEASKIANHNNLNTSGGTKTNSKKTLKKMSIDELMETWAESE